MVKPKLLLLDEPSRGLSPAAIQRLLETIQSQARQGMTVLVVDQALDWLYGRVDRLLVMVDGRLAQDVAVGEPSAQELAAAYFDLPQSAGP